MASAKGVLISVSVLLLIILAVFIANSMINQRADVTYEYQGTRLLDTASGISAQTIFFVANDGNIEPQATATVTAINATITNVSIAGIDQSEVDSHCKFNGTSVTIVNVTLAQDHHLNEWTAVYVTPNQGVDGFQIYGTITLDSDWLHPQNSITVMHRYNITSTNPSYTILTYNRTDDAYQLSSTQ